jgi:hypothetical protein
VCYSIAWNDLFITAYNSPDCLNLLYVSTSGSDKYVGDLFNKTNAAILDEIKKDYAAAAGLSTGVASVAEECNETPKVASSSAIHNPAGQWLIPYVRQNVEHFHIPIKSTSNGKVRAEDDDGDLFNKTNAAILDKIKKGYAAAAGLSTGVASVAEECNETPKVASSSAIDNSTGQWCIPYVRQNVEHFHISIQSTSNGKVRRSSSPSAEDDERPYKRQSC